MDFKESAAALLAEGNDPEDVVARCLAAISRRSAEVQSRSLITGEPVMATVQMSNSRGRSVAANDVMFTVGKLARMSRREEGDLSFDSDIGKIQANFEGVSAIFDMSIEDAKKLVEFSKEMDARGAEFSLLKELEVERDRNFGKRFNDGGRGGGGRFSRGRGGGGGRFSRNSYSGGQPGGYSGDRSRSNNSNYRGQSNSYNRDSRGSSDGYRSGGGGRGGSDGYRSGGGGRGGGDRSRSDGGRGGGGRRSDSQGSQQGGYRGRYDGRQQSNDGW